MDALTMSLVVALLVNSSEPLACEADYSLPKAIVSQLKKETGRVLEIREGTPDSYISEVFYNRIYFRGWFYLSGDELVACDIDFALKLDEEGKVLFIWDKTQKDM